METAQACVVEPVYAHEAELKLSPTACVRWSIVGRGRQSQRTIDRIIGFRFLTILAHIPAANQPTQSRPPALLDQCATSRQSCSEYVGDAGSYVPIGSDSPNEPPLRSSWKLVQPSIVPY